MMNQEIAVSKQETAVQNLPRKQRGLTTVEYAVAGALLVVAIVIAATALGGGIKTTFNTIVAAM